jgi:hypothetical protein
VHLEYSGLPRDASFSVDLAYPGFAGPAEVLDALDEVAPLYFGSHPVLLPYFGLRLWTAEEVGLRRLRAVALTPQPRSLSLRETDTIGGGLWPGPQASSAMAPIVNAWPILGSARNRGRVYLPGLAAGAYASGDPYHLADDVISGINHTFLGWTEERLRTGNCIPVLVSYSPELPYPPGQAISPIDHWSVRPGRVGMQKRRYTRGLST